MDQFTRMIDFLDQLEASSIYYTLSKHQDDMIMVNAVVPGERWEIEFAEDGELHVERFISTGRVGGEEDLQQFVEQHVLPEIAKKEP